MKKIFQTKFGDEGNCLAACVACLFPIELDQVPDFSKYNAEWIDYFEKWCLGRLGYVPVMYDGREGRLPPIRHAYHFIGGLSPRGLMHSVIGRNGNMVHDPHPSGEGLATIEDYTFFVQAFDKVVLR